ncbi:MAG: T9SS type A sorting domain-containing protein [candidate division WOR-3 bacterium]|nr:MAG: T9SS type A sorting domain-containing protein [candidate division WOR-3 bacterium]
MQRCVSVFLLFSTILLAQETGARYLIITHDDFYDAIQPLAEWKHRIGLRTKIVRTSQIGATTEAIRNYVIDAYNTWPVQPEFLLLVGSPYHIPFYVFASSCYSDNYYTNMDYDIYNEILSGRLTVHNVTEAQTVINKILLYERTPYLQDSSWFISACLIANEDYGVYPPIGNDSVYWNDIRHAKNHMLANGYQIIDTLSDGLGNNSTNIIQAVNNGRGFVVYRGLAYNNWSAPFDVIPDQTANGAKLPIVLSITCGTIGTSLTPATAERWLLTGTPTSARGGAGYFATTTAGVGFITFLRSAVCRGFFNAIFAEEKQTFGEACEGGRLNVYNMYGSASEYRGFTTLGDPAMMLWTAIPKPLDVLHDSTLSLEDDSLVVSVLSQEAPVESALVCVLLDTIVYDYGLTDAAGQIRFDFTTLLPGQMHVTVTARNKIPYLDSISVVMTHVDETTGLEVTQFGGIEIRPNPFTHLTDIRYLITDDRQTRAIKVYDITGHLVTDLTERISVISHQSSVKWDGSDATGRRLPAGVYFVELEAGNWRTSEKLLLIR